MATTIYCKTTAKGQQSYYLTNEGKDIMLFVTAYRVSNKEYYGMGCTVNDVFKARRHRSASVRRVSERIIAAIKYVEKEYDLCIFEQTERSKSIKFKNKKEQARRTCRSKLDLTEYVFEAIA